MNPIMSATDSAVPDRLVHSRDHRVAMMGVRVAGVAVATIVMAACHAHVSIGQKQLSASTLETQSAQELAQETHQPLPTVSCPSALDATVGAKETCTLTPKNSTTEYDLYITVDSVSGGTAHFNVRVGKTPISG